MLPIKRTITSKIIKFVLMIKGFAKILLSITLTFSMLSAVIPLHHILHNHHFISTDDCKDSTCKNHLKTHEEHCHTHSDAVFLADIPRGIAVLNLPQPLRKLQTFFKEDNYFQFFFLTKNKAPPVLIIT